MFRMLRPYQLAVDISVAAAAFLLRMFIGTDSIALVAVVFFMALAVGLRRVSPALALATLWFGVFLQLAAQLQPDIANAAVIPVLYVTSRYGTNVVRWAGLASAILGAFVAVGYVFVLSYGDRPYIVITSDGPQVIVLFSVGITSAIALFGISWTLGLLVRTWALARASRAAEALAVVSKQEAERETAIEQERTRIARDMHDVVAHSLAVVIAQADGARYALRQDPGAAEGALVTISTTAREALGDVRILLGQLRHSEAAGPQPVLADLDRLLDQVRGSGLAILREENGVPVSLGTGQQLAVYRIVQESLTNALRHGDNDAEVTVRFDWSTSGLELTVSSGLRDEAAAPPPARPGHGLDGMRERAQLAGGSLQAGPLENRFVVTAALPVATAVPAGPAAPAAPAAPAGGVA